MRLGQLSPSPLPLRKITLFHITPATPIYMPLISPEMLGIRLWSELNTDGLILDAPSIGKGTSFCDDPRFQTIYEGFILQKPWDQTARFRAALKAIEEGRSRWGCRSESDLRHRFYVDLPRLYSSIKNHGLLTQEELSSQQFKLDEEPPLKNRIKGGHEIKVGLNENGEFLFLDGSHRLSIAKILEIEKIPVRVMFIHRNLNDDDVRRILGDQANKFPKERTANIDNFEKLGGIFTAPQTVSVGKRPARTLRRRNLIVASSLNVARKRVLDVGCAEGLISFYMAREAESVVGVDHSSSMINIAKASAEMLNCRNVSFYKDDVRNEKLFKELGRFDLVVAWGFLHRITDPFELLYRLSNLTDTISLEWRTPVFPNMGELSVATHPSRGSRLDPMNTGSFISPDEKAEAKKVEGATAFWEMTPGAVKTILRRLGFQVFIILGYGEKFSPEAKVVAKHFNQDGFYKTKKSGGDSIRRERVHMVASRDTSIKWINNDFHRQFSIPDWDFGARASIFKGS